MFPAYFTSIKINKVVPIQLFFYFFHRYVFSKNLVETDFDYRELWLQLVGIFQRCLFGLAYRLSHLVCHPSLREGGQVCLRLSSQCPLSSTEALPQPTL